MNFPETISYGDLSIKHAEYNPDDILGKYEALYAGGALFRAGLEKYNFLDRRQLDGNGLPWRKRLDVEEPAAQLKAAAEFQGMCSRWDERKKVSRYTNYVGGMLDFFVQAVFKDDPSLIGSSAFWTAFNENADGCGNDLSTVARLALLQTLKFRRAYLSIFVPEVAAQNLAQQRKAGGLDPRMSVLCASDVDLWEYTGKKLDWVRTYRKDPVRTKIYGTADTTRELWTYISEDEICEYEIIYQTAINPPNLNTIVNRKAVKKHGFPRLPVIPIQINADLWAMQRLEDPALKLFNREAAMTWLINTAAFQILTVATSEQKSQVPDVAMGALWVGLGGKAEFVGPQNQAFDAQFKDAELCKSNMYEVFQALGINALAVQDQNARQSARAKGMDKEPLYALMVTFGMGLRAALGDGGNLMAEFRKEPNPKTDGLTDFDLLSLKDKFDNLLTAQTVIGYSETARKVMLEEAALAATPGADIDTRNKIIKESEDADLTEAPPPDITLATGNPKGTATPVGAKAPAAKTI